MQTYALWTAALVVVLDLVVTWLVLRSGFFNRKQKFYQVLLVWFMPVIGALLCLFVLRESSRSARPATQGGSASENPPGVGTYTD